MSPPLWFANFLSYCLQVILLVLVGTGLPALFRLRAPRVLLAYWQGLLVICLVLPLLQPWKSPAVASSITDGTVSISFQGVPAGAAESHFPLYSLIAGVMLAGMLVRLAWLALGLGSLRAIRRAAVAFDPLPGAVRELESRLGVSPGWYLSPEVESPATFGIRPPSILLPERFNTMGEASQRAIAGHELLHVQRRDWILNLVEELILTVLWFHPAVVWVVHRIRLSREQTVDAEVVRLVSARKPYMSALLEIAAGGMGPALGTAPTFLKERQLAQRIELLLKEVTMSKPRLFLSVTVIAGLLILAVGVGIWVFPLRASAETDYTPLVTSGPAQRWAVPPVYPPALKAAGIEGNVTLRVTIEKDGSVSDVENWAGNPQLAQAAIEAVRRWRYLPREKAVTRNVSLAFTTVKEPNWDYFDKDYVGPVLIYKPEAGYLEKAKAATLDGSVMLLAMIGTDGRVTDVKAAPGIDQGLTEGAVNMVKTWRYRPAMKAGKPVPAFAPVWFTTTSSSVKVPIP
jgi:D-alanyl-D-alanine endopeptidase (penicillin-binding protein 7)